MDNADFATELTLRSMEEGLAARRDVEVREATMFCVSCTRLIPWQRRYAVANCDRCIDCQHLLEMGEVDHAE